MAVGGSTCGAKMGGNYDDDEMRALGGAKKAAKKRAPSLYNKFYKAKYPEMKAKFPNLSAPQIMKKVAAEWQLQKK
jgi:hypothetical protein